MSEVNNQDIKIKQRRMFTLVVVGILSVSGLLIWMQEESNSTRYVPKKGNSEIVRERLSGLSGTVNEREIWMSNSKAKLDAVQDENKLLKNKIENFEQNMQNQLNHQIEERLKELKQKITLEAEEKLKAIKGEQNAPSIIQTQPQSAPLVTNPDAPGENEKKTQIRQRYFKNPNFDPNAIGNYDPVFTKTEESNSPVSISFVDSKDTPENKDDTKPDNQPATTASVNNKAAKGEEDDAEPVIKASEYVPTGTFVRSILLGGIDAPTGGNAQENPVPILLEIEDLAFLPNSYKYDFRQCRVLGFAHGEISSERAMARLETLSCIDSKGIVHEHEVKGYIFDETGKAGIRGTVVSKQGQMLANSLLAGIGAGIGSTFSTQSQKISQTALGTVTTLDPNAAAVNGLGTGVSTALNRLSDYYISLAEQIFPIVEVSAGRAVDIVFTQGVQLSSTGSKKEPKTLDAPDAENLLADLRDLLPDETSNSSDKGDKDLTTQILDKISNINN